ncbi:MAG: cytochrome c [Gemmatimonadetes bacterium]|nr:cytochrome c [Gemmatimonadota bacterium]
MTALVGAVALTLVACGGGSDAPADQAETPPAQAETPAADQTMSMTLPEGVTQAMVTDGKVIFEGAGLCATCHGADGTGTALAPDLTDTEWLNFPAKTYDAIVTTITNGVPQPKQHPSPMLARAGANLTDDQVRAVAAYVYTLSH